MVCFLLFAGSAILVPKPAMFRAAGRLRDRPQFVRRAPSVGQFGPGLVADGATGGHGQDQGPRGHVRQAAHGGPDHIRPTLQRNRVQQGNSVE